MSKYDKIDPKIHDEWGENILLIFLSYTRKLDSDTFEIIEILSSAGLAVDEEKTPALVAAIEMSRDDLIKFFISRACDVNKKYSIQDQRLLTFATWIGQLEIVKLLLDSKADIKARNDDGLTASHVACMMNESEIISLLIRNGADISVEDDDGLTPFSYIDPEEYNYEISVKSVKEFGISCQRGIQDDGILRCTTFRRFFA